MKWIRRRVGKLCQKLSIALVKVAVAVAKPDHMLDISEIAAPTGGYVPAMNQLNPWLFNHVQDCMVKCWESDSEGMQAELNGCMEAIRPKVAGDLAYMMGQLAMRGYTPEEALVRTLANTVHLGMHVERVLKAESKGGEGQGEQKL